MGFSELGFRSGFEVQGVRVSHSQFYANCSLNFKKIYVER